MTNMLRVRALSCVLVPLCLLTASFGARAQANPWYDSYQLEYLGKYAEAQAKIEPQATQRNEFALIRSAWLLYLQGKYADSAARYRAAAELNPRSTEAPLGAMLPLMAEYRWAEAIESGRKVLADNPWDYTTHVRLMVCEEALSRWDDLARHAAEVSQRYPTDATVMVYWARAESALRNIPRAKQLYAQVMERVPYHIEATKFLKNNP